MITGIWLYWVWVLAALALDYVILNCTYTYDDNGNKTDKRCTYPMWAWLVLVVYPFIPVLNVIGFVFFCTTLTMAEKKKDCYLRGKFFEDVKRENKDDKK